MDDQDQSSQPEWLYEFEALANEQLGRGSACHQVHPIIERWLDSALNSDPPQSREAVWQAMSCLTTEVITKLTSDNILDALEKEIDQEEIASWVESILLVGRAFQIALENGELDDL